MNGMSSHLRPSLLSSASCAALPVLPAAPADLVGDLLFNAIAPTNACPAGSGIRTVAGWRINDRRTLRTGARSARSATWSVTVQVAPRRIGTGNGGSAARDDDGSIGMVCGLHPQDDRRICSHLTANRGIGAFISEMQPGSRINVVRRPTNMTSWPAGQSRAVSPPPFDERAGVCDGAVNNSNAAGAIIRDDTAQPEWNNSFDRTGIGAFRFGLCRAEPAGIMQRFVQ